MASFARMICPVAKSVPSPSVIFTILLPALVSWGIMTEASLWFVLCLLSPILQGEKPCMVFSQPPEGKFIHRMLENIVPFLFWKKKNRLTFYRHDYTSEWFKRCGFRPLSDKVSYQKIETLREMEVWSNRIRFFFPRHLLLWFLLFLSTLGKLPHSETQLSGKVQHYAWVLLTLYKMIFQFLLSSVLQFTHALVSNFGDTDSKKLASSWSNNGRWGS